MKKKQMFYDVNRTRMLKSHYRPSGFLTLVKSVFSVLMLGGAPISHSAIERKRP
jgi:hypothetical protein